MAEPGAGLYNDSPTVGSDRGEWQMYQQQQGQGALITPPPTMAAQVEASPPVFSQSDSVRIIDGAFQGLVGIVHNIAHTQDGQYSYALGDISEPANANKVYQYLESQLELPGAVSPSINIPDTTNRSRRIQRQPTNNGNGLQDAVNDFSNQAHVMELVVDQLSALGARLDALTHSVNTQLGRINVHVTYERGPDYDPVPTISTAGPAIATRRSDGPASPDDELDASGEPTVEAEAQYEFIEDEDVGTEGESMGDPD